jgi:hypothetical protein
MAMGLCYESSTWCLLRGIGSLIFFYDTHAWGGTWAIQMAEANHFGMEGTVALILCERSGLIPMNGHGLGHGEQ